MILSGAKKIIRLYHLLLWCDLPLITIIFELLSCFFVRYLWSVALYKIRADSRNSDCGACTMQRALSVSWLGLALVLAGQTFQATAGIISSPGGNFQVGIHPQGSLYDLGVGFRRLADGYDYIQPGTPREAWGVSAGLVAGFVDPYSGGIVNISLPAAAFGPNSASISVFLNAGSGNLLRVDQLYTFAAENVLQIDTSITNVSATSQAVLYSRHVDWDVAPTPFQEFTTILPFGPPILDVSYDGFQSANPLVPLNFPSPPGGGTFLGFPSDTGVALRIDLGTLNPGDTVSFRVFHGINTSPFDPINNTGQSEAALRAQLQALGATWVSSGRGSNTTNINSAAFGVDLSSLSTGGEIPEPASWAMCVALGLGTGLFLRRNRS